MPAYPKKLPIVLIATLATLLLTSGAIVTGELLRMTAPRAVHRPEPAVAGRCADVVAVDRAGFDAEGIFEFAPGSPDAADCRTNDEIEHLADDLVQAGGRRAR